ncbi:MAG: polymorphic toxin type 33 domain-containing protein [Maricaulaceae bacterium]
MAAVAAAGAPLLPQAAAVVGGAATALTPVGWALLVGAAAVTVSAIVLSNAADDADENLPEDETGCATHGCTPTSTPAPPEPEPEPEDEEKLARDAKRLSKSELDRAAKNNGYEDIHDLKDEYGLTSKQDIFRDKNGDLYEGPRKGPGPRRKLDINQSGQ